MERLTGHNIAKSGEDLIELLPKHTVLDMYAKLQQIEDIEEELGIDLLTLFKAIFNGIYVYGKNRKIVKEYPSVILFKEMKDDKEKPFGFLITGTYVYWKECGKSWALTKEELK